MQANKIASRDEWLIARKAHLLREKELTRLRDQVSAERRQLPWVKIEKTYVFDTPDGRKTLRELFDGRSQLIVYHFKRSAPAGRKVATAARSSPTISIARTPPRASRRVPGRGLARALADFQTFKERMGWRSRGWRPMAATSPTTSTSPRMKP